MIIDKILPAIREKFPVTSKPYPVLIQQDNAKPHAYCHDPDLLKEFSKDGWNIELTNQPPNSPDLNVLDLGFFNSIQALQQKAAIQNLDDLIREVEAAFAQLEPETLDNVFLTHQGCMEKIMETDGGNEYKIPHIAKAALRRRNELPVSLQCSALANEQSLTFLNEGSE